MFNNHIVLSAEGSTSNGERLLSKFNLDEIVKVTLEKQGNTEGGPANVTFHFSDGDTLLIKEAFGIGYGGTGPWGIHQILVKLGVPQPEAEKLFIHHSKDPLEFKIPRK